MVDLKNRSVERWKPTAGSTDADGGLGWSGLKVVVKEGGSTPAVGTLLRLFVRRIEDGKEAVQRREESTQRWRCGGVLRRMWQS